MHIDGFDDVHSGYVVDHRNLVGRTLLDFCLVKTIMCVKYMA